MQNAAYLAVTSLLLCMAGAVCTPAVPQPDAMEDGSAFVAVPELEAGFRLLYEQKFPEARDEFSGWETRHSEDPFGHIAVAASYLFEEFYRQGVLTSGFFLDDKKFLRGIEGKPDAARMNGFRSAIARARETARVRLGRDPKDHQGLFALTMAAGMEADALTILEKKQLDGLRDIKEASADAQQLLALRPDATDAWLALGAANYIVGCLSSPKRFLLWFGGIHGDRQLGMEQLGKTATNGRYLRPFAKILLALAARREKQAALAQKLLRELTEEFPASPLFAAEYAQAMGWPIPAQITRHTP